MNANSRKCPLLVTTRGQQEENKTGQENNNRTTRRQQERTRGQQEENKTGQENNNRTTRGQEDTKRRTKQDKRTTTGQQEDNKRGQEDNNRRTRQDKRTTTGQQEDNKRITRGQTKTTAEAQKSKNRCWKARRHEKGQKKKSREFHLVLCLNRVVKFSYSSFFAARNVVEPSFYWRSNSRISSWNVELRIPWQAQYLVSLKGDFTCSAHWKWWFICGTDHSWDSFCLAGTIFGEVGGWL